VRAARPGEAVTVAVVTSEPAELGRLVRLRVSDLTGCLRRVFVPDYRYGWCWTVRRSRMRLESRTRVMTRRRPFASGRAGSWPEPTGGARHAAATAGVRAR